MSSRATRSRSAARGASPCKAAGWSRRRWSSGAPGSWPRRPRNGWRRRLTGRAASSSVPTCASTARRRFSWSGTRPRSPMRQASWCRAWRRRPSRWVGTRRGRSSPIWPAAPARPSATATTAISPPSGADRRWPISGGCGWPAVSPGRSGVSSISVSWSASATGWR